LTRIALCSVRHSFTNPNVVCQCDRGLPCANCKSRNKESACHYEAGAAPSEKERRKSPVDTEDPDRRAGQTLPPFESLSTAAANWGYSQAGGSTLGFLKKIETVNGETGFAAAPVQPADDEFALKERYKSLIRQLPAKSYIQRLVDVYFEEFNEYVLRARSPIIDAPAHAFCTANAP
jgi:hypothetical protein